MTVTNPWLAGPGPTRRLGRERLEERILHLLSSQNMCVLATTGPDGPLATPVRYFHQDFTVVFTAAGNSPKMRNIAADPRVSIGIFAPLVGQASSRGAQLFGRARVLVPDDPDFTRFWPLVRWQSDHVERSRSLDEPPFGPIGVVPAERIVYTEHWLRRDGYAPRQFWKAGIGLPPPGPEARLPVMEPPEMINAGELVLKRWEPAWAGEATTAVRESLPELKPFLPWATDDYDDEASRVFLEKSMAEWDAGTTFNYGIFTAVGELIGGIGLMTRVGPEALEIGYWLRTTFTRRGHMTAAVEALTRVALTLPGIERVVIRHDVANAASAAVAAKAGFVEIDRVERESKASGETGTDVIRERRAG